MSFSTVANDSDRIDELERVLQETKERLLILESILKNNNNEKKLIVTDGGWKSIANWRKLATDMKPSVVRSILGEPQKINGGQVVFWYYKKGGVVTFMDGKVHSWGEPDQ